MYTLKCAAWKNYKWKHVRFLSRKLMRIISSLKRVLLIDRIFNEIWYVAGFEINKSSKLNFNRNNFPRWLKSMYIYRFLTSNLLLLRARREGHCQNENYTFNFRCILIISMEPCHIRTPRCRRWSSRLSFLRFQIWPCDFFLRWYANDAIHLLALSQLEDKGSRPLVK